MGPADLPSRPRNSWTAKDVPWTDGKQSADYHRSVLAWMQFHDLLPPNDSNKLPVQVRGIILKSNLFGRAKDLVDVIPDSDILSSDGPYVIANVVHKFDPLASITEAYGNVMNLFNCVRGDTELFSNFVPRFEAAMAVSSKSKMSPAICGFLLLNNARIDHAHKVSILSSLATKTRSNSNVSSISNLHVDSSPAPLPFVLTPAIESQTPFSSRRAVTESIEAALDTISFEDVASIIRSCDATAKSQNITDGSSSSYVRASSSRFGSTSKPKTKMDPQVFAEYMKSQICNACGESGHWASSPDCKKQKKETKEGDPPKSKTLRFNNARLAVESKTHKGIIKSVFQFPFLFLFCIIRFFLFAQSETSHS